MIQTILSIMQMIISFGSICVLVYTFKKFIGKPHAHLDRRVGDLEHAVKCINQSLLKGNDRFKEQEDTNEVLITSILALIEFEVHYCETEQKPISDSLKDAKNNLNRFFARNRKRY